MMWLDLVLTFFVNSHSVCTWLAFFMTTLTNGLLSMLTMIEWPTSSAVSHVILSASLATTPVP